MKNNFFLLLPLLILTILTSCSDANDLPTDFATPDVLTSDETQNATFLAQFANDYPFWRGITRNGIAQQNIAPLEWNEKKNIAWKTLLPGAGHGTPTILGDHIYLPIGEKGENDNVTISILILDRKSGKIIKQAPLMTGTSRRIHPDNSWTSQTIASDGERLFYSFLLNSQVHLFCCDLDGNVLWNQSLGSNKADHGYSASPLIYKKTVIVCNDNQYEAGVLKAFDSQTGNLVWETERPNNTEGCYASPVLIHSSGKDQLILNTCGSLIISYDPQTGQIFWFVQTKSKMSVSSAAWDESNLYISEAYPRKILNSIRTDGTGDVTETHFNWSLQRNPTPPYTPSLLLNDGLLYCLSDQGEIACLNAKTSKMLWKDSLNENIYSSPVLVGDKLYFFGRQGTGWIYKAGSELEKIAENKLESGVWATPVFLDGGIYLRTLEALYFIKD
ncbi:MAG: PQQ-binding-like beta-propeller repeat protein [Planctomycetia bacterium]|nr:PQQ-binding-like beta-propeller repeat protein [Planctomycetia bacterium]